MNVIDLQRKAIDDEKREILIFNPLKVDVNWKFDGRDQPPIPSKENVKLKPSRATVVGSLIVDMYLNTKEPGYTRDRAIKMVFPND